MILQDNQNLMYIFCGRIFFRSAQLVVPLMEEIRPTTWDAKTL